MKKHAYSRRPGPKGANYESPGRSPGLEVIESPKPQRGELKPGDDWRNQVSLPEWARETSTRKTLKNFVPLCLKTKQNGRAYLPALSTGEPTTASRGLQNSQGIRPDFSASAQDANPTGESNFPIYSQPRK